MIQFELSETGKILTSHNLSRTPFRTIPFLSFYCLSLKPIRFCIFSQLQRSDWKISHVPLKHSFVPSKPEPRAHGEQVCPQISVQQMVAWIVPFHSGPIVPPHCILGLHVTPVQVKPGGGECPRRIRAFQLRFLLFFSPLLPFFVRGSNSGGFPLSLHRFYARVIVAYRLSGPKRDSMWTLPKSKNCEVYCVSAREHCPAAQVSHHRAPFPARKSLPNPTICL